MKKQILAIFMCLMLVVVPCGQTVVMAEAGTPAAVTNEVNEPAAPAQEAQTKAANTITVGTADELVAAVAKINEDGVSYNLTLTANIDVAGKTVGQINPEGGYTGVIDGGNFTIKNYTLIGTEMHFAFIAKAAGCTVRNLTFDNATVCTTNTTQTGDGTAAVVISTVTTGAVKVENVNVVNSVVRSGGANAGAIVASFCATKDAANSLTISECRVEETIVEGAKQVGAVLGGAMKGGALLIENTDVINSCVLKGTQIGGIIGRVEKAASLSSCTIDGCDVLLGSDIVLTKSFKDPSGADVVYSASPKVETAGSTHDAGGIVGHNLNNININECVVVGAITASGKHAGGIIGRNNLSGIDVVVDKCIVDAVVTSLVSDGAAGSGGVIGTSKSDDTVKNTVVAGRVVRKGADGRASGIVGSTTGSVVIENCVSIAALEAVSGNVGAWVAGKDIVPVNSIAKGDMTNLKIIEKISTMYTGDFAVAAANLVMKYTLAGISYSTNPAVVTADGKYNIRFLAYIDSADYAAVGMKVEFVVGGETKTMYVNLDYVYTEVYKNNGDSSSTVKVTDIGNYTEGYMLAMNLTGVSTSITEFTVTPYVKLVAGGDYILGVPVTAVVEIAQ